MNWLVFAITFIGVNLDFFFILLFLLKKYKVRDVILGYVTGVLILVAASFFLGKILAIFMPEWLLGILGFLPIWMAIHDNDEEANQTEKANLNCLDYLPSRLCWVQFVNFITNFDWCKSHPLW